MSGAVSGAVDGENRVFMGERGSILMLVLFTCVAVAVVVQVLSTAVLCAERAVVDEAEGRARLDEKNAGLAALRRGALHAWETVPWTAVRDEPTVVEGSLSRLADSIWVMEAAVRQEETVSRLTASAWLERGRDGLDLPLAALVARSVTVDGGRELPWLETDRGQAGPVVADTGSEAGVSEGAAAYLRVPPADPLLGEACVVESLAARWELDDGWREFAEEVSGSAAAGLSVAVGAGTLVLAGRPGHVVRVPAECSGRASGVPALVIVAGGANLDARDLGDFYGVIVVDQGSVRLDGTNLHGSLFVSGEVDFGHSGRVLFSRSVLRWATDRSLHRARLVPGSRWEGTE